MSKHHYDHIRSNEKFHELVKQKSRLGWSLAALMLVVYFSFILVIAFFPQWLGVPLAANSVLTWGLAVGIAIILFTFALTGFYVHKANNLYDVLMREVIDASTRHVDGINENRAGESS